MRQIKRHAPTLPASPGKVTRTGWSARTALLGGTSNVPNSAKKQKISIVKHAPKGCEKWDVKCELQCKKTFNTSCEIIIFSISKIILNLILKRKKLPS